MVPVQSWEVGFIVRDFASDRRRGRERMAHPASLIAMMMWPILTRRF